MAKLRLFLCTAALAGICIVGTAAQAGPNTPSMPSISPSISPTRPDFNMRTPNALRDGDIAGPSGRSSLKSKTKSEKKGKAKAKAKAGKQGRDSASRGKGGIGPGIGGAVSGVSAVTNPTPATGGKDAEKLPDARRASLERMRGFIGALDRQQSLRQLKELLDALLGGDGPLAKAHAGAAAGALPGMGGKQTAPDREALAGRLGARPLDRQGGSDNQGSDMFAGIPGAPSYGRHGSRSGGASIKFGGPGNAPRPAGLSDPSGAVAGGKASQHVEGGYVTNSHGWRQNDAGGHTYREMGRDVNGNEYSYQIDIDAEGNRTDTIVVEWNDGTSEGHTLTRDRDGNVVHRDDNPPDSQPTEEGTGRPSGGGYRAVTAWRGGRNIVCDFFGCRDLGTTRGRIGDPSGPDDPEGTSTANAQSSGPRAGPGAATDPCPDCGTGGGGGGTPVRRPSDVGWGGPPLPGGEGVGGGSPGPRGSTGAGGTTPQ
jgi:hypothetical protein